MEKNIGDLASSKEVDVGALAGIFNDTTNSYKHLFFQSLLSLTHKQPQENRFFTYSAIGVEMLALAWYPNVYFNLSFGRQDQIRKALNLLEYAPQGSAIGSTTNQTTLRKSIWEQSKETEPSSLLRYVPHRLLTPFFSRKLSGLSDEKKDPLIRKLASEYFNDVRPLYRFHDIGGEKALEIHPAWMSYIHENHAIIEGWAKHEWLSFLQTKNPSTPALTEKIRPPEKRSPLKNQTQFWQVVMTKWKVPCLYSGVQLGARDFSLDHFIPWAFVCHDRPWNLVPVKPEANSAKSHSLPHKKYINHLAKTHAKAIEIYQKQVSSTEFDSYIEPYVADLKLIDGEMTSAKALNNAYESLLLPLLSLARNSGFPAGWEYKRTSS